MTTRTNDDPRPLSPHLQVYMWQWTMAGSILHRFSGLVLSAGMVIITAWLLALAAGPEAFERVTGWLSNPFAVVVMVAWTLAMFYHLLNGIRHLFWDAGMMLELKPARASGLAVMVASALLTAVVWLMPLLAANGGAQ